VAGLSDEEDLLASSHNLD